MLFTDKILKCISDEAFEIFKQLPIYKYFELNGDPKISLKQGTSGELITSDYGCVKLEIQLNFETNIEKIEIISKNNIGVVKTTNGKWYCPDSVIIEDRKIKISDLPSSVVYEESFNHKTTVIYFTDKYHVMHKKEMPTDMVAYMG